MAFNEINKQLKQHCAKDFAEKISLNNINDDKEKHGITEPIYAYELRCVFLKDSIDIYVDHMVKDGTQYLFFMSMFNIKEDLEAYQNLSRADQLDLVKTVEEEFTYQLDLYMVKPYIKDIKIFDDENKKVEHTESIVKVKEI